MKLYHRNVMSRLRAIRMVIKTFEWRASQYRVAMEGVIAGRKMVPTGCELGVLSDKPYACTVSYCAFR